MKLQNQFVPNDCFYPSYNNLLAQNKRPQMPLGIINTEHLNSGSTNLKINVVESSNNRDDTEKHQIAQEVNGFELVSSARQVNLNDSNNHVQSMEQVGFGQIESVVELKKRL